MHMSGWTLKLSGLSSSWLRLAVFSALPQALRDFFRWVIPRESAPLESIHCAGKFPSIPTPHAIEAYGFLAGFSMCFSLGFDNALRWVFNRSSLGFHKGPIHRFSQVCCRFFAGFL